MARKNFFENGSIPGVDDGTPVTNEPTNTPVTSDPNEVSADTKRGRPSRSRISYTVKVEPDVRKILRKYAFDNETTASSVIETLVRKYVATDQLSMEDVRKYSNYDQG